MELTIKSNLLPVIINEKILRDVVKGSNIKNILMLVPATKPCFYKMWSLMDECKKQDMPFFVMHSGQHYDDLVGHGFVEFHFKEHTAIDLQIRGDLSQKSAELFLKIKEVYGYLKENYPSHSFIPYVNGDTLTTAMLPAAWLFASNLKSIQGEAGLRSMYPEFIYKWKFDGNYAAFFEKQFTTNWRIMREEPFPEQYDTYVGAAGCQYFFAPVDLNKENLLREGYHEGQVFTVGNTVVDVIKKKKQEKAEKSIFELYPALEKNQWLRIDIHRRENLTETRFKAIVGSVVKMVENGRNVVFIELNATKSALEKYGLRQKLIELQKKSKNFLFTPLWQQYAHVVEFLESEHCYSILTDSGSMQEEMNELQKPCFTCRFSSDRPETIMDAHSNLLIPPMDADFIAKAFSYLEKNEKIYNEMKKARKLYGAEVAEKIIAHLKRLYADEAKFFWAQDVLQLWKEKSKGWFL